MGNLYINADRLRVVRRPAGLHGGLWTVPEIQVVRDVRRLHGETRYLVPGTMYLVPGTWYQVLGTRYLVLGTRYLGTKYQALGTKCSGTKAFVPSTWVPSPLYQGLGTISGTRYVYVGGGKFLFIKRSLRGGSPSYFPGEGGLGGRGREPSPPQ